MVDVSKTSTKYEDLLEWVGGFGIYQAIFYIWYILALFPDTGALSFMVFAGISPTKVDCDNVSQLTLNKPERGGVQNENIDMIATLNESIADCFEYAFQSINKEWDLTGSRAYLVPLITSLQMAGMVAGPIGFGNMSDLYGRKPCAIVAMLGLVVTGICCAFSFSWQQFAAARFFHGLFFAGGLTCKYVLFAETTVQRWRLIDYFLGPMLGYLWSAFLAAVVTNHWRTLQLLYLAPALVVIPWCLFYIQESPKFLLEAGKPERAVENLFKIAQRNRLKISKETLETHVNQYRPATRHYQVWHLFYNRKATLSTLTLFYSWAATACVYYGLLFNLNNVPGSVFVNFTIIMLIRLLFNSLMVVVDRCLPTKFGRRQLHQTGMITAGICMVTMAVFLAVEPLRVAVPVLTRVPALVGAGFCGLMWCATTVYSAELFPTVLRGVGAGLGSTLGRGASALAPQICLLSVYWVSAPYVVFIVILGTNFLLAYFFLPETKGKPLPDFEEKIDREESMKSMPLLSLHSAHGSKI